MAILSQLNSILLGLEDWKSDLTPEALSTGWCGLPPATESEILRAEERLGITLPPSYRSFLSISNGWRPFSDFIEQLLPVMEIQRFQSANLEDLELIQKYFPESDVSDDEYLDYQTHIEALRPRYYPECLLVGRGWDGGGGEIVLLNPHIVSADGEWEAIFFANWVPGNRRYRSFFDLIKAAIDRA